MSIKSKMQELSIQQRKQLAHAFDQGFSQHIEFGIDEFIGVHLDRKITKQLQIKEIVGVWSYGTIAKDV